VTPYYDSLLAKVTAWGRNREGARQRMRRALAEFRIVGVATNIPYLQQILELPDFVLGNLDTGFLDRNEIVAEEPVEQQHRAAEIAALLYVTGHAEEPVPATNGANGNGAAKVQAMGSQWRERMGSLPGPRGMGRWPRSI
jgi:pyruvate carboxylase